jgi:putative transposase
MARLPRLCIAGHPHLIVHRSHNRQPFAIDDADRERYLGALREAAAAQRVALHGYALVDDEVLLLATPPAPDALGRMMQNLGRRYVGAFNRRHGRTGTVWEGRYRNTLLESGRFLLPCLRHVELAPVRGGLAVDPADYRWSSAAHHLGLRRDPLVSDHPDFWTLGNTPFEREHAYRILLNEGESDAQRQALADAAWKGWVLGSRDFAEAVAEASGRRALPLPRGRPRRQSVPT